MKDELWNQYEPKIGDWCKVVFISRGEKVEAVGEYKKYDNGICVVDPLDWDRSFWSFYPSQVIYAKTLRTDE